MLRFTQSCQRVSLSQLHRHYFAKASVGEFVKIVEVGPRDGLQNERKNVDTAVKVRLIEMLADSGISVVEATSFVSPKWVPQMADADAVMKAIKRVPGVRYPVLAPNMQGYLNAVRAGVDEIAVFAAATDSFALKNTGKNMEANMLLHREVARAAAADGVRLRGYVSCVLGCPYEGRVEPESVLRVTEPLLEMGCYEVSLGDTIGIGNPLTTEKMLMKVTQGCTPDQLAVHFHNTYGTALANIVIALQMGIRAVDSSVAGLGGCPYARGATGNVATEDVLHMVHGMGFDTGVDMQRLIAAGSFITEYLGVPSRSLAATAILNKMKLAASTS